MAHEEPPSYLLLEMKTSGTDSISLGQRDLEGIKNDGFLVAVLDETSYEGPVIAFIPYSEIDEGIHYKSELREKRIRDSWWVDEINDRWSDWILNIDALDRIISDKHSKIPGNIEWYLKINGQEKGLKKSRRRGATRAQFLRKNLQELHRKMNPKIEGQFHQYLVMDIINRSKLLRYEPVNNPTGVPDIHARRLKRPEEVRLILKEWIESINGCKTNVELLEEEKIVSLYNKLIQ